MNKTVKNRRTPTVKCLQGLGVLLGFSYLDAIPAISSHFASFIFAGILLLLELTQVRKRRAKNLGFLLVSVAFCLISLYSNYNSGGDLYWYGVCTKIMAMILFVHCCYLTNTVRPIYNFTVACDLWIVISFIDVSIKVIFGNFDSSSDLLLLCGYDNGLGSFLLPMMALNLYFLKNKKRNILVWSGIVLSILQVFMVWSVTAMVGMILMLGFAFFVRKNKYYKIFSPLVVFIAGISVFVFVVLLRVYDNSVTRWIIQDLLGRTMDFTSRTRIWDVAFLMISQSPWIGHGRSVDAQRALFYGASSAHNFYLDVLCQVGIIGLALLLIAFSMIVFKSQKSYKNNRYYVAGLLFWALVAQQFESYCAYSGYPLFFVVMAFAMYCDEIRFDLSIRKRRRIQ